MMHKNDFPKMSEQFDRSVRRTLDALPEQQQRRTHRTALRRVVSVGLAAALCFGGTAFAAYNAGWFPMFFPNGGDGVLAEYVRTPETPSDENDKYRLTVESVLFDESAGAGLISLHLENKAGDGVMPFTEVEIFPQDQGLTGHTQLQLTQVYGADKGQFGFELLYGDSSFCGSNFYLNESRSTANDYYLEGAFIPSEDYTAGTPLRLVAQAVGETEQTPNGAEIGKIALEVALPEFQPMPYLTSENGDFTLSQIGFRMHHADEYAAADFNDSLAIRMKDGSELVIIDNEKEIARTLYALGFSTGGKTDGAGAPVIDTEVAVLARTFALEDVQSLIVNGTEYPLS